MSTVLKNILNFTGLVIGVPTSLPHLLNVSGVAKVPRVGGTNADGFTVTANATNVIVTRTNEAVSDDVRVYVEFWHSLEDVEPPGGIPSGYFPFFFASGGGGGSSNENFVFRPGGIAGGDVYTDWSALYAALQATPHGLKLLQFDSTAIGIGDPSTTLAFGGGIVTLTRNTGPAFTAAMVGQEILIEGAPTPSNNGVFFIASFSSATQVTYANAAGVSETLDEPGQWTIYGGITCVVPTAGMPALGWDMTQVEWHAYFAPIEVGGTVNGRAIVSVGGSPSGGDVILYNLRKIGGDLNITNLNTTVAPVTFLSNGALFEFGVGVTGDYPQLTNSGVAPFWDCSALIAGRTDTIRIQGTIGGTTRAIEMGASPSTLVLFIFDQGRVTAGMVTGSNAAAAINIEMQGAGGQFCRCAGFPGTIRYGQDNSNNGGRTPRLRLPPIPQSVTQLAPVPSAIALTAATGLSHNATLLFASAGAIAQTLPPIRGTPTAGQSTPPNPGAIDSTGFMLAVKQVSGGGTVALAASAGETIDGVAGAAALTVPAGGARFLISDGISNWIVVGAYL